MNTLRTNVGRLSAVALTTSLLLAWGCSDDGLGTRYKVSGRVTYKGAPVDKGSITFHPEGDGRAASGAIDGGSYSLSTVGENDGAVPGKYKVTIVSKDVDLTAAQAKTKGLGGNVALPQDFIAKAGKKAKNNIPTKYAIPDTSPLAAEISAAKTLDFELTD